GLPALVQAAPHARAVRAAADGRARARPRPGLRRAARGALLHRGRRARAGAGLLVLGRGPGRARAPDGRRGGRGRLGAASERAAAGAAAAPARRQRGGERAGRRGGAPERRRSRRLPRDRHARAPRARPDLDRVESHLSPVIELTDKTVAVEIRGRYERYETAFAGIDAPFAFVDLDAMWANARDMLASAAGKPIRVASKSLRCRALIGAILDRDPGFRGLMSFTLREALFQNAHGFSDLLLAYPTADRAAIRSLTSLEAERPPVLIVDSTAHLDLI